MMLHVFTKITQFWLAESSAVQDKCMVRAVQIAHRNSGLWLVERQWKLVLAEAAWLCDFSFLETSQVCGN